MLCAGSRSIPALGALLNGYRLCRIELDTLEGAMGISEVVFMVTDDQIRYFIENPIELESLMTVGLVPRSLLRLYTS